MRRRTLLGGALASLVVPVAGPLAAPSTSQARRLVVVFANGGWDATLTIDPKLGNPAIDGPEVDQDPTVAEDVDALATIAGIPIVENLAKRSAVSAFFQRWGSQTTVVNGVWVGSIAHDPCRWRMLSGRVDGRGPDVVAMAGATLGQSFPLGSIDTSGLALAGPLAPSMGSVGARSQLEMLLNPQASPPSPLGPSPAFAPSARERSAVRQFLEARVSQRHEAWTQAYPAAYAALAEAQERADRLVEEQEALVRGLEIGSAPSISSLVTTTIELLRNDVCSSVLLDSGHRWDTHENNVNQHNHFNTLFADLSLLMGALEEAGLLDSTLVAVLSEMGRTPRLNAALGKDHWPHASAMMMGGPVRGGRVLGATDDLQESLPVDLATGEVDAAGAILRYDNLVAGILAMLDVDHDPYLPGIVPFLGPVA